MADLPIPPYLQSANPDDDATTPNGTAITASAEGRNPAVGVGGLPSESQLLLLCLDYLRDLRRSYTNDELAVAESIDGDWLSLGIYGLSRAFTDRDLRSAFGAGGVANAATAAAGGSASSGSASALPTNNSASAGNDAWFDPVARGAALGRQTSPLHKITPTTTASNNGGGSGGKDGEVTGLMIPSTMDDINREVLYVRDPNVKSGLPPSSPPRAGTRAAALAAARRHHSGSSSASAGRATSAATGGAAAEVPSDPSEWYVHDDAHPSNIERFYPLNGLASERSPLTLGEITAAGLTGLGARSRIDAEREMVRSDLFGQFLGAVRDKGFFDGTIPDDDHAAVESNGRGNGGDGPTVTTEPEKRYEERYRKVVSKFRTKLAAKAVNSGGGGGGIGGGSVVSGASPGGGSVVSQPAVDAAERQRRRRQKRIAAVKGGKDPSDIRDSPSPAADNVAATSPAATADTPVNASHLSSASFNQIDIDEAERLKSTGNAYMQKKQYGKAIDAYTSALKVVPNGPTSHVYYSNRAAALLSMKSFEEAIKDSERSLALKPDYGKAHARLGLAQFLLGRYQEAVDAYEVALELDPDNKASRSYLEKARKKLAAQKVVNEKKKSSAPARDPPAVQRPPSPEPMAPSVTGGSSPTKTYEQQRIDEKEANRYKSKGNACMASRDYEGAISAYTSALKLCPDGPSSHVYFSNRAAALCYLERYEEAELDSETSVQLRPDYGKGYARLGLSRFFLRDYGGAVLAYQEALKYEPDNMASQSYLAKAMKKVEQEEGGDAQDDESEI
mmetsp:Transcript_21666/g.48424  ORF Transcript_21666/g.48424 Transcript_21666/m.48424 type:complete len:789 (+) Transcript_21666:149-2515(+)